MGCPSQPLSSTLGVESTAWPAECRAVRLPLRHQEGQCPRQGLPQPSSGAWAPSCSLEGWRDGDGAMGMERCRDAATEQRGHVQLLQAPLPQTRASLPTPGVRLFCFQTCHCLQAVLI